MINAENVQKQKTLMPSLKENQRYVVYSINVSDTDNEYIDSQAHKTVVNQCITLLGVFESSKAGVMTVKNNGKTGILRVNSRYVDKIKICLGLIQYLKIKGKEITVNISCIYVSGMLNKVEKMII